MASYEAIYWALPDILPLKKRDHLAKLAHAGFRPNVSAHECAGWCLMHPLVHAEAISLLRALHAQGIELTAIRRPHSPQDDLAVRDPHKAMTPDLRERLGECRQELIALLRIGPVSEMTWREFARSGRVARFRTAGGEQVRVAADNADPCHPLLTQPGAYTVFSASEMERHIQTILGKHARRKAA